MTEYQDGYGKYHLFKEDHIARYNLACGSCEELIDQLENCGGYRP